MENLTKVNATKVKAKFYNLEVSANLELVKAENAIANAIKAQQKADRIEIEIDNFKLKNVISRLETLVKFNTQSTDETTTKFWYTKNVKEYRSPLFIFNQICKGDEANPYNHPKKAFKDFKITTKKYNGITMISFLPLDLFLSQISMQGNYSPNMLKIAFNEADKAKSFELADTIKASVIKGQILNDAVVKYSKQEITLTEFIDTIAPYFTAKEWANEKVVKTLSTMLVTAEIAKEDKENKDKKAEAKKAAKKK